MPRQRVLIETQCENCGQTFSATPYRVRSGLERFCRPECSREWRRRNGRRTGYRPKLSPTIAAAIRGRYAAGGITQKALALQYAVHQSAISAIITGTAYRASSDSAHAREQLDDVTTLYCCFLDKQQMIML